MPHLVLQSPALAGYKTSNEQERIGKGFLQLSDDGRIEFVKKKLLGGTEKEPDHIYYLSNIIKVKDYSDGLDVEVYFQANQERQAAQVYTFTYVLKGETDRWLQAMSKKQTKPSSPESP